MSDLVPVLSFVDRSFVFSIISFLKFFLAVFFFTDTYVSMKWLQFAEFILLLALVQKLGTTGSSHDVHIAVHMHQCGCSLNSLQFTSMKGIRWRWS